MSDHNAPTFNRPSSEYVISKTKKTAMYYVKSSGWTDHKRYSNINDAFKRVTELQDRENWDTKNDM